MRRHSRYATAIVSVLCIYGTQALAQEAGFLDLSQVAIQERLRQPQRISGGAVGAGDGESPKPRPPLELTIVSLDKSRYKLGDEIVLEIKLENVSAEPIDIPWSPHSRDVEPGGYVDTYRFTHAYIPVDLEIDGGQSIGIAGISLYGRPEVPSSVLRLRPGRWVRVRYKVTVHMPSEKLHVFRNAKQVGAEAKTTFSLYRSSITCANDDCEQFSALMHDPIPSSNKIRATIVRDEQAN